jgi:hypothetical protein
MKKTLLFAALSFSINAFSQPNLQNGNNIPVVGTTATLYSGSATSGIGNPGANQTWDFSNVSFSNTGVAWTVVNPASTPYFSSFPTSNYAWTFNFSGTLHYFYFNISSTKFDVLADNLISPGSGNDFTPNSKSVLKFPFAFGDTVQDVFQKVGGTPKTVLSTYDGYGTLITPFATYTNVWRVWEDQGAGLGTYTWENENPLQPILVYTISNNSFTLFGNAPLTGINDKNSLQISVDLYPNPATDHLLIKTDEKIKSIKCSNYMGQELPVTLDDKEINISSLSKGIYFLEITTFNGNSITKKFIKQ